MDSSNLRSAILYEYARTSKVIAEQANRILDCDIDGKPVRKHLADAIPTAQKKGQPYRPMLEHTPGLARQILLRFGKRSSQDAQQKFAALRLNPAIIWIINHKPDFPKAWLLPSIFAFRFQARNSRKLPAVSCHPCAKTIAEYGELGFPLETVTHLYEDGFFLSINWEGNSAKTIMDAFGDWLRDEIEKHPERKKCGEGGKEPLEKLKWLAAYRFHEKGVSFNGAQDFIFKMTRNEEEAEDGKRKRSVLPIYRAEAEWHKAIAKAKRHLRSLEKD